MRNDFVYLDNFFYQGSLFYNISYLCACNKCHQIYDRYLNVEVGEFTSLVFFLWQFVSLIPP